MNPALWLDRAARLTPDAPALMTGERVVADYAAFAARAAAIAGGLAAEYEIARGDRVAIFSKNRVEYLIVLYAIWRLGAVAVPINGKLHEKEAAWIMADADVSAAVITGDAPPEIAEAAPRVIDFDGAAWTALEAAAPAPPPVVLDGDDVVWLFYTSGTTGRPKGVMIPARAIEAMTLSYFADVDEVRATDAALYAAPMSHGAGIYNFMHVIRGARHVVPESGGFDAAEILDIAPRLGDVHMFAAPTMVRRLVDAAKTAGVKGDGIRSIIYGGGPMYVADIIEAVKVMGPRFIQIYGQGECPMCVTALPRDLVADRTHPRWRDRLASIGRAQSCCAVRILDEDGREVPPGEPGEIAVHGAPVMRGYWRNNEATAKTIRDGWLWTGDVGVMDKDGFVTMRDRSKDMIISGGTNIYPREVEEALLLHPSVHEVAVVGRPHEEWGEEVIAFIVPAPGQAMDKAALDAHCLDEIARFKRPKDYFTVDELPKNNYGKVLKTDLRARLAAG